MLPIKSELKSIILYEIEHVFGRRIVSSRDCIELSEDIFRKTKYQLNPNTLRRFFRIIKAEYPPSQSTLTILSKYCGFQNLDDIYRIKKTETLETGIVKPETVLYYLVSMFQGILVKDAHDETFISLVIHTIKFLNTNKFLTDKFQSLIAKTSNGTHFYFELLVNVDKLNSFYGNGLRYYLRERGTVEAEIFTASLYTLRYWLNGDDKNLLKSSAILECSGQVESMHPYMQARHLSALLLYNQTIKKDTESLRIKISNFLGDLDAVTSKKKYLYQATYILSEALLLTGYSGESLFYLKQAQKKEESIKSEPGLLNYSQNYNLLEAYSLFNLGHTKLAEKKFNEIKSSEFPFLNKRFCSILYLSLLQKLKPKGRKHDEQLKLLIIETGFKKLNEFLPMLIN